MSLLSLTHSNLFEQWTTGKTYNANAIVQKDGHLIKCLTSHTSGTYATDVSSGYWQMAYPMKNYIINGNFDIWQRGTSSTPAANAYNTSDRFLNACTMSTPTVSRSTDVPNTNSLYSKKITGTNNGGAHRVNYRVESSDLRKSGVYTLSFWIKVVNLTKIVDGASNTRVQWAKPTVLDNWAAETTTSVSDINIKPFLLENTWVKIVQTVTLTSSDIVNGVGFHIRILSDGTGGVIDMYLSQAMLNEGPAPAAFQTAGSNIQQELALCQRYYEKSYNLNTTPGTIVGGFNFGHGLTTPNSNTYPFTYFKVPKRGATSPTITIYSPVTGLTGVVRDYVAALDRSMNTITSSELFFSFNNNSGVTTQYVGLHYTADYEL